MNFRQKLIPFQFLIISLFFYLHLIYHTFLVTFSNLTLTKSALWNWKFSFVIFSYVAFSKFTSTIFHMILLKKMKLKKNCICRKFISAAGKSVLLIHNNISDIIWSALSPRELITLIYCFLSICFTDHLTTLD